jgi:hypothetical protein
MSTKLTFSQKQKKKHRQHNKGDFHCKLFFSFPELSRKVEKLENRLRKLSGSLKVVEDSEVDHAVLADLRHDLDRMAETILFLKDRCGKGKNKNLQSQKIDFIRSSFDEKFKRWREQQVCRECFCVDNKMILSQLYSHNFVDFRLLSLASIITPPQFGNDCQPAQLFFHTIFSNNSTSVKVLQFSSFAQPQSKCLLLFSS